ncbi:dCTP deaminase [Amycolatopsis alkalitolerans]|uniref:dCTP deaminase n=1 Tax=Amycolatopsis alkalitolerans TaxID=2547244 RepID=UPI00190F32E9|nr:dCTP deaminase [Amycolatopsis alkalitolerans]
MNLPSGGVLTDREIRRAYEGGELVVSPWEDGMVRPAALSLRLGEHAFVLESDQSVDVADRRTYPKMLERLPDERGRLRLEPGEVLLAPTLEKVGLSERLAGLVDGTSDYARLGIGVVLSGQVSPGFGRRKPGVLTLEIVSHLRHPVLLRPGARICNLMLFASTGSARAYDEMPHNYSSDQAVAPSRLADHVRPA